MSSCTMRVTSSASPATDPRRDMARTFLLRGVLAGLIAGLVGFGFAKFVGEPALERALVYEAQAAQNDAHHEPGAGDTVTHDAVAHDAVAHETGEDGPVVSRAVQSTFGLLTGTVVNGIALGGLLGLMCAVAYGRIGGRNAQRDSLVVAFGAFVVVALVPFLKYPATPPAVGDPETIGHRTGMYFAMLLISIAAAVLGLWIRSLLVDRRDAFEASLIGGGVFVAGVALAYIVMSPVNEIPGDFPANDLWRFRTAAIGLQAVLWLTIGVANGVLARMADLQRVRSDVSAPQREWSEVEDLARGSGTRI